MVTATPETVSKHTLAQQATERINQRITALTDKCYMVYWDKSLPDDIYSITGMLMFIEDELRELQTDINKLLEATKG